MTSAYFAMPVEKRRERAARVNAHKAARNAVTQVDAWFTRTRWDADDDAFLLTCWKDETISAEEIAHALGRTLGATFARVGRLRRDGFDVPDRRPIGRRRREAS